MRRRWLLPEEESPGTGSGVEGGLDPLLLRILHRREIRTPEALERFLHPGLEDLETPDHFADMGRAVMRVMTAIAKKELILVYGDYDVDGITGTAVITSAIKAAGGCVEPLIPDRMRHGYGLKREALDPWIPKASLVITVDNGIAATEEVRYLSDKKIDTIVIDHHEPRDTLPDTPYLISPRKTLGESRSRDLAACGLAFKFAWALLGSLDRVKGLLDLVALGTIADMAPLLDDNRILVRWGLDALRRSPRPGLKALFELLKIRVERISTYHVAFLIAPRINAVGRVGTGVDALRFLMTTERVEAENLARLLDEGNKYRQKLETVAFEEAVEKVENEHHFRDHVIVVSDERWHQGITGILAMRLVERFHRPAFVISLKEGLGKGSGRSIPQFLLFENMKPLSGLFESFGGHEAACGLTIREEKIPAFKEEMNLKAQESLEKKDLVSDLPIDAEIRLDRLSAAFLQDLETIEPFGAGNPRPVFLTRGLRVRSSPRRVGPRGIAFYVDEASSGRWAEVASFKPTRAYRVGDVIDVVYHPRSVFADGVETIQLVAEDEVMAGV